MLGIVHRHFAEVKAWYRWSRTWYQLSRRISWCKPRWQSVFSCTGALTPAFTTVKLAMHLGRHSASLWYERRNWGFSMDSVPRTIMNAIPVLMVHMPRRYLHLSLDSCLFACSTRIEKACSGMLGNRKTHFWTNPNTLNQLKIGRLSWENFIPENKVTNWTFKCRLLS